jgi:sugar O-acyltransferase (sialic acid O-acetyltransferase NeuD family)
MHDLSPRSKKVILCGLGKQAELTHLLFTHDSDYMVAAFCVEMAYFEQAPLHMLGLPVVAFETMLADYPPTEYCIHIAIGQNHARQRLFEKAKSLGYSFASYISAQVRLWPSTVIGEHVFIDQYTWIHPFVTIGDNTLLIGARIGHHSRIGQHSLLSSCILGGSVMVGDKSFVGMGTIINDNVTVGHHNLIGSGCLIARSTPDNAVYSAPATKQRTVSADRVKLFNR